MHRHRYELPPTLTTLEVLLPICCCLRYLWALFCILHSNCNPVLTLLVSCTMLYGRAV